MTPAGATRGVFAAHPDPWLTGLLDRPAYRFETAQAPTEDWRRRLAYEDLFVTAKVDAARVAEAGPLQDMGFHVVDTALTFDAPLPLPLPVPGAADPRVRFAEPGDRAAVGDLAGSAFVFSRFHADPAIPASLANRIKAAWADNFFSGERGDGMVVARDTGGLAGFLQLLWAPGEVLVIDLVAVAPRAARSGLARAMISFAAANGPGDGRRPASLRVGTQAANIPSVRVYESLGFRLSLAQFVLHHHGRNRSYRAKDSA